MVDQSDAHRAASMCLFRARGQRISDLVANSAGLRPQIGPQVVNLAKNHVTANAYAYHAGLALGQVAGTEPALTAAFSSWLSRGRRASTMVASTIWPAMAR